ncbi:MAG: hypothetical protein K2K94_07935, partial [Muribaculaceae bacterium]|nr:hypothetical protein [Muribaculaceae bacterium]
MKRIQFFRQTPIKYLVRLIACLFPMIVSVSHVSGAIRSNSMAVPFIQETPEDIFEKALIFQDNQALDSALIYYSWLTESHRDSKDPATQLLVGKALSEMGQLYYIYYNDYMSAYRCLAEAETMLKDMPDRNSYAIVLLNLGNLFNIYEYIFPSSNGGQTRGKDYYARSIDEGVNSDNWNLVCSAYINFVMVDLPFKVDGQLNKRMKSLLADSIHSTATDYKLASLLCAGTEAIMTESYSEAKEIFTAMRDSIGLTAARDRYMADLCLSAVSVNEGDYQEAIENISRVLDSPSDRNNADVYMEVYDLMAKYYAKAGNQDKADEYRTKYFEAKDSITKLLVELEPTRIGLELEQVRNYAHKIDAEKKQATIIVLSLIDVVLLLAIVANIIYRKNRQLTHKNRIIFNQTRSMLA